MSILNYWVASDRAVVAVDSNAFTDHRGGNVVRAKMIALPHAGVVLAGRGSSDVFGLLVRFLIGNSDDFDMMRRHIEEQLPGMVQFMNEQAKRDGFEFTAGLTEIALVGWSSARASITATYFMSDGGAVDVADAPRSIAPGGDLVDFGPMYEAPWSPESMMSVAQSQLRMATEDGKGKYFGGRLLFADVTREAVCIRSLGSIVI